MTFLEAVNEVQRLMRETVTTASNSTAYSMLVGLFINKAKRMVEDAYDWGELKTEVEITTSSGTALYPLTSAGQRFRILRDKKDRPYIYNVTKQYQINRIVDPASIRMKNAIAPVSNSEPEEIGFEGVSSSGDVQALLYPTPDAAYSIKIYGIVPQDDFDISGATDDNTQIKVPGRIVTLLAWAFATAERGEDEGFDSTEAYQLYLDALGDIITYHDNMSGDSHKDLEVL